MKERLRNFNIKKAVTWAGTLLMAASLLFIGQQVAGMWGELDLSMLTSPWVVTALLLLALTEGGIIIGFSVNYRFIVKDVSGIAVPWGRAVCIYALTNLYKYIPGGVLFAVGRNHMAVETEGLGHGKVAVSTLLEGVLWVVAGGILAAAFAFEHSLYYIRQTAAWPLAGIVLGLVVLAALPVMYKLRRYWLPMLHTMRFAAVIKRMVSVTGLMFLWGASFLAVLAVMGQPMTMGLGITVMGLFILSWLAGFLTPGAPSGLGIREVVLLMFMSGTLDEGILLSAIVMHRALQVLGDVLAYGGALVYARGKSS